MPRNPNSVVPIKKKVNIGGYNKSRRKRRGGGFLSLYKKNKVHPERMEDELELESKKTYTPPAMPFVDRSVPLGQTYLTPYPGSELMHYPKNSGVPALKTTNLGGYRTRRR